MSTLGGGGTDGPPGIFIMDCETFDIMGRREIERMLAETTRCCSGEEVPECPLIDTLFDGARSQEAGPDTG